MKNIPSHIFKLVANYISKEISEKEFHDLQQWINEKDENKQLFSEYLHVYKKSRRIKFIESIDENKAWNTIGLKLVRPLKFKPASPKEKVKHLKRNLNIFKYAAFVTLFLGIGYMYQNDYFQNKSEIIIPSNNITLQLENGNLKIIDEDGTSKVLDSKGNIVGEQNGVQLVYAKDKEKEILEYNTLTVPYGKRFELKLSDGTNVHLNAGTSLKYPVNFINGENRKVFLKGEAYFDVAKDTKHPFVVNVNDMDVRVLGTQFNVSSYPEDDNINTVLVEGSISIYKNGESYNPETSTILKPGFKATWLKSNHQVSIGKADIEMHTAWIEGRIVFRRTPFEDIIKKLERHYDVVIINKNQVLAKQEFGASFNVETIKQVLESFNANYKIEYTIENNQIIIH